MDDLIKNLLSENKEKEQLALKQILSDKREAVNTAIKLISMQSLKAKHYGYEILEKSGEITEIDILINKFNDENSGDLKTFIIMALNNILIRNEIEIKGNAELFKKVTAFYGNAINDFDTFVSGYSAEGLNMLSGKSCVDKLIPLYNRGEIWLNEKLAQILIGYIEENEKEIFNYILKGFSNPRYLGRYLLKILPVFKLLTEYKISENDYTILLDAFRQIDYFENEKKTKEALHALSNFEASNKTEFYNIVTIIQRLAKSSDLKVTCTVILEKYKKPDKTGASPKLDNQSNVKSALDVSKANNENNPPEIPVKKESEKEAKRKR